MQITYCIAAVGMQCYRPGKLDYHHFVLICTDGWVIYMSFTCHLHVIYMSFTCSNLFGTFKKFKLLLCKINEVATYL